MHRIFLRGGSPELGSSVTFEDEAEIKHIVKVLRLGPGEEVEVCFEDGREFVAEIEAESKSKLELRIEREHVVNRELRAKIALYQGLPKQKKLDSIVQKAIECGVSRIIPVEMERSVAEIKEEKSSSKLQRLNEIARGAASQSKRSYVPPVDRPCLFKHVLEQLDDYDLVILCDEEEARELHTIREEILKAEKIAVIIGPEGGISDGEREVLRGRAIPISLGTRILRTETSSIVILSQLAFIFACS